jgi:hypothetical protein
MTFKVKDFVLSKIYAKLALLIEVSQRQTSSIPLIRLLFLAMLSNVLKNNKPQEQAGQRPCFFKSIDQI